MCCGSSGTGGDFQRFDCLCHKLLPVYNTDSPSESLYGSPVDLSGTQLLCTMLLFSYIFQFSGDLESIHRGQRTGI